MNKRFCVTVYKKGKMTLFLSGVYEDPSQLDEVADHFIKLGIGDSKSAVIEDIQHDGVSYAGSSIEGIH